MSELKRYSVVLVKVEPGHCDQSIMCAPPMNGADAWLTFANFKMLVPGYELRIYKGGELLDFRDADLDAIHVAVEERRPLPRPMDREGYAGSRAGKTLVTYRCAECGSEYQGPDVGRYGPTCDHK